LALQEFAGRSCCRHKPLDLLPDGRGATVADKPPGEIIGMFGFSLKDQFLDCFTFFGADLWFGVRLVGAPHSLFWKFRL
jgi:hypothetical protein